MRKIYKSTEGVIYGIFFLCSAGILCSAFSDGEVHYEELVRINVILLCAVPGGVLGFFTVMLLNFTIDRSDRLKIFSRNVIQIDLCTAALNANSLYLNFNGTDPFSTVFMYVFNASTIYIILYFAGLMGLLPSYSDGSVVFFSSYRAAASLVSSAAVQLMKSRNKWISHLCSKTASELLAEASNYGFYN